MKDPRAALPENKATGKMQFDISDDPYIRKRKLPAGF